MISKKEGGNTTPEEAIKWVDDRMCWGRGIWTERHMPTIDECWIAGSMAIEALRKEIPEEPIWEGDGYADGEMVYDTWSCPVCGESYEEDKKYKHCPECGQAIKWEVKKGT